MSETIPYTFENSNLFYAAEEGRLDLAQESLDKGASPDYSEIGLTTLIAAVIANHIELTRLFLEHGADPNLKSADGLTPLMQAKSAEMVKLLAEYGANPSICDGSRNSALRYFIESNCVDAVRAWLQLGWPVIRRTKKLLNRLLSKGRFEMITLLTGYQFEVEHPIKRIAEFKARWP